MSHKGVIISACFTVPLSDDEIVSRISDVLKRLCKHDKPTIQEMKDLGCHSFRVEFAEAIAIDAVH